MQNEKNLILSFKMIGCVTPSHLPLFTDGMVRSHLKLYKDSTLWVGLPKSSRLLAGEDLKSTERWSSEFDSIFHVAFNIFRIVCCNELLKRGEEERPILNNSIFHWLVKHFWLVKHLWLHCTTLVRWLWTNQASKNFSISPSLSTNTPIWNRGR